MKTCEKPIERTGLACGRKLRVRLYISGDINSPNIDIGYSCSMHRYAWCPKGMPNSQYDLEELLQRILDE